MAKKNIWYHMQCLRLGSYNVISVIIMFFYDNFVVHLAFIANKLSKANHKNFCSKQIVFAFYTIHWISIVWLSIYINFCFNFLMFAFVKYFHRSTTLSELFWKYVKILRSGLQARHIMIIFILSSIMFKPNC